jgi:hypothetical protein
MATAVAILMPFVVMGVVDLLWHRYGAESRPGFDERLRHDERPNW